MNEPPGYTVTTDQSRFDFTAVAALLNNTYWAANRSREDIEASFRTDASIPFAVLDAAGHTIGVARAVTDRVTFAWVCDVVIDSKLRGRGLGKLLIRNVVAHPELNKPGLRMVLGTRDAHGLYEPLGFFRRELMWRNPGGAKEDKRF